MANKDDFKLIYKEFEVRVVKLLSLSNDKLPILTKYFVAILSVCDNIYNQHFAENALIFFAFIGYEIDTLLFGKLPFSAQDKSYKGFISKQTGSFEKSSSKKESTMRLTTCCVENLNNEAGSDDDKLSLIVPLSDKLLACNVTLQKQADLIVSALLRKNRGKGLKYVLNAKFYGGFYYSSESPTDTDARGVRIPKVSDGFALLKNALDVQKRDLFGEISSLSITPLAEFPHADIVAAEDLKILVEIERVKAEQLAFERRCVENEIIAQKKDEEKKRKRAEKIKNELAAREQASSDSSSDKVVSKVSKPSLPAKKSKSKRSSVDSDDEGGFTMKGFIGDKNDDFVLSREGRKKPVSTGALDLERDGDGYDDIDDVLVKNLRAGGVASLKNFILRGGDVSMTELSGFHGGVKERSTTSDVDIEWDEVPAVLKGGKKSQLEGLDFSDCESSPESGKKLRSNFIDKERSSDDEDSPRNRGRSSTSGKYKQSKKAKRNSVRKPKQFTGAKSRQSPGINMDSTDSDSSYVSDRAPKPSKQRKAISKPSALGTEDSKEQDAGDKLPRKREIVGLTEHQVIQYANVNLMPFQMTAAQHQAVRSEQFEVGGQLMSDDQIVDLLVTEADGISKKIDVKFLTFIKQNLMVEVFKDVHFMANVIQFYRAKRYLHNIPAGDEIVCVWQEVLKEVAADSINDLVISNKQILERMEQNLLDMKEYRRELRHEYNQVIDDEAEKEQNEQDFRDLEEYKNQMMLSKKALEEIEKVMKRRINSIAHSTGAKIICIWAKLNNYQHLLSGNMSKFEKKFLLDASMPFYSVLNNDLSRKWSSDLITSPNSLFPGIDLKGRNRSDNAILPSSLDIEMDVQESSPPPPSFMRRFDDSRASEKQRSPSVDSVCHLYGDTLQCSDQSEGVNNSASLHRVRFSGNSSSDGGVETSFTDDNDTPPQDMDVVEEETEEKAEDISKSTSNDDSVSYSSPEMCVPKLINIGDNSGSAAVLRTPIMPVRPIKPVYTSACLNGTPNNSPGSDVTTPAEEHSGLWTSNSKQFMSPLVTSSVTSSGQDGARQRGVFSVSNRVTSVSKSYLSTISSASNASSSSNSPDDVCNNAAVLFDQLKHMSADAATNNTMFRFIEVMNGKSPTASMPTTKAEEQKILDKTKAKQVKEEAKKAKEEAKKAVAAADALEAANLLAASTSNASLAAAPQHWTLEDYEEDEAAYKEAKRLATDSYSMFQKLFLYFCKKHVEVKDAHLSLQFFGQRLVKTLSNSALLRFLLFLLRNRDKKIGDLTVILLHDKRLCGELKCIFGIAYDARDYFNIIGDGYCVLRSMFACFGNEKASYRMSVADMRAADQKLFKSIKSKVEFHQFLGVLRESINLLCGDETVKAADKKKLRTTMSVLAAYPQLRQIPAAYWGCLDWVAYASFNCTAFSTNYLTSMPGYAQLHCSSVIPRDMSTNLLPFSVDDIHKIWEKPDAPNFCVLEGQHAFVVQAPPKEVGISSFKTVLGMFLSVCLRGVADIVTEFLPEDISLVMEIIEKMIADNSYAMNVTEVKLMAAIVKHIGSTGATSAGAQSDEVVVLCDDDFVPPVSLEAFCESRVGNEAAAGEVVDLCDSDTGDIDRTKVRATKRMLARQEQELAELKWKFEASERENKFLLRLIEKDPLLMHDPPLDISPE